MARPPPPPGVPLNRDTRPTHTLSVRKMNEKTWHWVGVGWVNEFGAITIRLNPMVDLGRLVEGDVLKLFPKDYNTKKGPGGPNKSGPEHEEGPPDFGDDDIPF